MPQSVFHFMAQHTGELILIQAKGDSNTEQAAWRREAQRQFLDWLGSGGFHSEAEEIHARSANENSGTSAAVLQSHPGTQCEELKFTRVRIRDAVE
ncbi:hypothetical protein GJ700_06590 [Duganella sp. FT92W]|uniref:Uncharacterized protein n=1 Tax=Pseudoduganella rivuli TaxID=2666085 RepID=A0A7X2LRM8_9BURK|nr:hypothetical protein [Pseudoduganella rivuli]MRV71386.1 hypothetical protein [Pseudoduganella rivuli]